MYIQNSSGILLGNSSLLCPRRRWKDNINMDLKEINCEGGNWTGKAQDEVQ
jgi:hypothetical protein